MISMGPKSGRGFVLPAGNAERGRVAFVELKCHHCHRVDGVDSLPTPEAAPAMVVVLGGKVTQLKSYGELVTSIILPSKSRPGLSDPGGKAGSDLSMTLVNDTMTVTQLVDLVTFLHPRYKLFEPAARGFQ
jgi:sulfur-oxidizing protein SoxX